MNRDDTALLRTEEPRDRAAVEALVEAAFRMAEYTDGNEHRLVAKLRRGALELSPGALQGCAGTVRYPAEFELG